ncbi:hypothetical protein H8D36_06875 [archaeon]|nr:hypothetical protein [archaeon]
MVKKKSVIKHEIKHDKAPAKKKRPCMKLIEKLSKNYWIVATVILAILLIGTLVMDNSGNISANKAAQQTADFLNTQTGGGVEVVSVEKSDSFYMITVSYQGQEIPVYTTTDGKFLVTQPTPITDSKPTPTNNQPAQTNAPKSDKPEVELYVWGYCPYGVQAQGPLAEVANLLGDSANIQIVPYHDGHGAYENQQNKIQSCIQELEPTKYWDYAAGFVANIYPKCSVERTEECDLTESTALMKTLGIDSAKVLACVDSEGDTLFTAARQLASTSGVSGSPTLRINGVIVNTARNAEAYKTAICAAYNNAPSECGEVLDSSAAAAAGNC